MRRLLRLPLPGSKEVVHSGQNGLSTEGGETSGLLDGVGTPRGEVGERLNAAVSKTVVRL